MNAEGIDVSKAKITVAVLPPSGEIVSSPFDIAHIGSEIYELTDLVEKASR